VDLKLKALFTTQLTSAHKSGILEFGEAVSSAVKLGQKQGAAYDFAQIVNTQRSVATQRFEDEARATMVEGAPWSTYKQELVLFQKDLDTISSQLRKDELRRLAGRVERWVRSKLTEAVGLEFSALGSSKGASATGDVKSESDIWDRIWAIFVHTVLDAEQRFAERASHFDASAEEVDVGLWRLRRKSWAILRAKIEEEFMEGNLLLKLRENFEEKFRYDDAGVPRIWRPSDDIESVYTTARESTLRLIPLLSRFRLRETSAPPSLVTWIGPTPSSDWWRGR
jgi:hypothetical protein